MPRDREAAGRARERDLDLEEREPEVAHVLLHRLVHRGHTRRSPWRQRRVLCAREVASLSASCGWGFGGGIFKQT